MEFMIYIEELLTNKNSSCHKEHISLFRTLFEYHPDVLFILSTKGKILATNRIRAGIEEKEVLNSFYLDYIPENYKVQASNSFSKTINGATQHFILDILHKNGIKFKTRVSYFPIWLRGEVIGILGVSHDLSKLEETEQTLFKTQNYLESIAKTANVGSWDYDVVEDEAFWSQQMYEIVGADLDFIPTMNNFLQLVHEEDRKKVENVVKNAIKLGESYSVEYRIIHLKTNEVRYFYSQGSPSFDENRSVVRLIGTMFDITSNTEMALKLKESEKRIQDIYQNLDLGVWSVSLTDDKKMHISSKVEKICGYQKEEFMNSELNWVDLIHPDDREQFQMNQQKLFLNKPLRHFYRIIHKNGNIVWIHDYTTPYINKEGELVRLDGLIIDITKQKEAEEKITFYAYHDSLTGLPNRRNLDEHFTERILNKLPFTVMYMDIDRLKIINDTFSYLAGDQALMIVAERIKECLSGDMFLSRIGGDEFVLISSITSQHDSHTLAKQILRKIEEPFEIGGHEINLTISIGISSFPINGDNAQLLLKNANLALNEAKKLGRNMHLDFNSSMAGFSDTLLIERELKQALKKKQFEVHYQPRIDTKSQKVIAAEALIRWKHPELGMISPGLFIPIAEENGLIHNITEFVIETVCKQLKQWTNDGYNLTISINVSTRSFLRKDFTNKVMYLIEKTGVTPPLLEMEITETSILLDKQAVESTIDTLKQYGIKIALDDFGTGYSSLTHLKRLQIDTLKIDRSFINEIGKENRVDIITTAILQLAKNLGIESVAEGVETAEQFEKLAEQNCDQIQGYYFSKPLCAEEFSRILTGELSLIN
ncbi:EAL domain-containing protein [Bacillus tianshenii]|nr:EAL domain-containing protein [Bacillus tianshenii]